MLISYLSKNRGSCDVIGFFSGNSLQHALILRLGGDKIMKRLLIKFWKKKDAE